MAAAGILFAGPTSTTVTTTGSDAAPVWSDGATLASGSFAASTEYLLIGWGYVQVAATNNRTAMRLVEGATPTVLTDADGRAETTSSGADTRHPFMFMRRFTQGVTPVAVKMQIGATSTADTEGDTFLMAIPVSAFGTEGVDWFWQEVTADYTTTTTPAGGASVTFTPNGTDTYAVIADAALRILSNTVTQTMKMELHDTVAGILQNVAMEGEEITTLERYQWMLGTAVVPTAVSHTFSARFWHATTAHTVFSSRVIAFKLNRFQQFVTDIDAAIQTPATAPTWTNIATVAPTPTLTGNWAVLGFFTDDPNSISTATDGLRTRIQINASGGGLVSNPGAPYGDDAPEQYGNDTTDLVPMFIGTRASLTSGSARTINLDVSQQTSVIRVLQTSLIAFSDELAAAGGGATVTPTNAALTLTTFAPVVRLQVTPSTTALALATFAPQLRSTVTPTNAALTLTTFAPTVTAGSSLVLTPAPARRSTATFAPQLRSSITPTTAALVTARFAPVLGTGVTPTNATLALATFAPQVRLSVTPAAAGLTLATFTPTVTATAHQLVTPAAAALSLSTFAPTVTAGAGLTLVPSTAALVVTAFTPTVTATAHQTLVPTTAALVTARFTPTVTATNHQLVTPATKAVVLATFAPTVTATAHLVLTPATAALVVTTFAPGVTAGAGLTVVPTVRSVVLATFAPTVTTTAHQRVTPTLASLALATLAPVVTASNHQRLVPAPAGLVTTAFNPAVTASDHQRVTVALATLALTRFEPDVLVALLPSVFYGDPPIITRASSGTATIRRAESDAPRIVEVSVVSPVIVEVER
jgi:hypothetical protein